MRWLRRRRRDRAAHARRHTQLCLALVARENAVTAIDRAELATVITHALAAVQELDAAIALLGARVPELAHEVAALRPAIYVHDYIPQEMI